MSVLLGEEGLTVSKHQSTRKTGLNNELVLSLSNFDVMVGLDPRLRFVFIAKNNDNVENNKKSVK
jgi:hypothetical protein